MGQTEKFSRIVEYKGKFDISEIIANFNKLKTALKGRGVSEADILDLDSEIKKVAELDKVIQKIIQKGFKTPKEFSDFTKLTAQASQEISKLSQNFKRIDSSTLTESMKTASAQTKSLSQSVERLQQAYLNNLKNAIKDVRIRDEIKQKTRENFENLKQGRTVEHDITTALKQQFTIVKDDYDLKEKELNDEKEKLRIMREQLTAKKALQDKDVSLIQGDTAFQSAFLNPANYKGINGAPITNEQFSVVQMTLGSVMSSTKNSIQDLVKALQKQGITIDDVENKTAIFTATTQQVQEKIKNETQAINAQAEVVKKLDEAFKTQKTNYDKFAAGVGTGENFGKGSLITDYNQITQSIERLAQAEQRENLIRQQQQNPIPGMADNIRLQDRFNISLQAGNEATKQAIKDQNNLDSTFDHISNRLKYMLSFMNAWNVALRTLRQTFNDVQNIDKAFSTIAMVTDKTISDLWGKYDEYAQIANDLGQSTESVIKSSALYYQQGLATSDALTLTKDTMRLATLANIDFEQSTKLMTAALRSFHMELDSGAHITDVYSELAANAAANVQDIAYAMSKTSSIAASAGMSFENTAAMLTTMIEVTQEAPENLGTAMKSVIARFTEVKKNISDIEGDIEAIDINKVDAALKSVGISLKDQAGQIRNLDEVFLELSSIWNDLDRNTTRYIATLAAGSRQQSRFLALMESYERTQELIEIASDSAGRSTQQFAKYADSVENKINRLKNTWEQFRINLADEKFYKSGINFVNDFLSRFTKIDKFDMTAIVTWGLTIGKNLIQGIIQSLKQGANGISSFIENIVAFKNSKKTTVQIQADIQQAQGKIETLKSQINEMQSLSNIPLKTKMDGTGISTAITSSQQLEYELNKCGLTIDITNTKFKFLDVTAKDVDNTLYQLHKTGQITEKKYHDLTRAVQINKEALSNNNSEAIKTRLQYDQLSSTIEASTKKLQKAKNWSLLGRSIGSTIGTGITMGITGSFSAEEIAKALSAQTLLSRINALMSAVTAAVGAGTGAMKAAFMSAGGPVALILTAISTIALVLLPKIIENIKIVHDKSYTAKKAYQEVVEHSQQLSKELDKQNKTLEKLNEKWKNVKSAKDTFEELSQKVILTEEEQQNLNEATKTLTEQMPDLISYYDAQGNAVIEINDRYKEKIKLLKQEVIEQEKITALTNTQLQNSKYSEIVKGKQQVESILKNRTVKYGQYSEEGKVWYSENISIPELIQHFTDENFFEGRMTDLWNIIPSETIKMFKEALITSLRQQGIEVTEKTLRNISNSLTSSEISTLQENFLSNYLDVLVKKNEISEELKDYYVNFDDNTKEAINNQIESIQTKYQNAFKEALLKYDDSKNKELIEGLLSNIYLTGNDIQKAYIQTLENSENDTLSDQEMENLLNQLINIPEMQRVAQEIENLTPELAESVKEFYNQLSALSSEARAKIISDVGKANSGKLIKDMEKQDEEIQKRIKESRNKYLHLRGFEFTKGYIYGPNGHQAVTTANAPQALENAFEILQVRAESVFYDIEKKAEKIGGEAGDQYIIAMANAVSSGKLTDAAITYLNNYDWESMDFIHMQTQIQSMAAEMVKQKWVNTVEEGQKIIEKFIKEAKEENLGIVTEFKTVGDIEALQTTAENAFEILQNEMDNFTPVFRVGLEADEAKLTQEEYDKFTKAIRAIMNKKDSPWAGLFNISDYTGYNEKGQVYLKNLTKLRDILFGEQGPLAGMEQLNAEYERLQSSGTLTPDMDEAFQNLLEVFKNFGYYQKDFAKNAKEAVTTYRDIASSISSIASDYQSIADEQEENGFLSSKSLDSFLDGIKEINKQMEGTALEGQRLDVTSILSRNENGYEVNTAALKNYLITLIATAKASKDLQAEDSQLPLKLQAILDDLTAYEKKKLEEAQKKAEEERQKQLEKLEKAAEDAKKAMEDAQKEAEDAQKEIDEANEALQDAREKVNDIYKEIEEKQKEVIENQKELNEAMYGTGDRRKSTLDGLYNYDQLLKQLTNDIADAKARLTDYESTNVTGDVGSYGQLIHNKKVTLLSQQRAYQGSLSTAKALLSQYSAYYTEINGRLLVDVAKLNSAAMPDKIKDQIESTISAYNDSVDKIHDITNEIKSLEKEFVDFQKTYRDKFITLQEKVISTLKQQAQEELNVEKEKYAALEEADNEYVNALEEAINKQRELRNLAKEDEELAQKEKKLSLMQRDTSGANQKDILKQEQDVEKTRESINDKKVDSLVKSLKELYKTQKQSRDAEVKYRETVLQNATFIEEANAVISSWQTADELVTWFMEHSAEVETMTLEQLEVYSEELAQMYTDREIYMNTSMEDFMNMLNVSQDEINSMSVTVSETLSTEMERAFQQTREEVDKTIDELKEKLQEAEDAIDEAKEKLKEALDTVATEITNVQTATEALALARENLAKATDDATKAEQKYKDLQNTAIETQNQTKTTGNQNGYGLVQDSWSQKDNSNKKQTLEEYIDYLSTKKSPDKEIVKSEFQDNISRILLELSERKKNHGFYDPTTNTINFRDSFKDAQFVVDTKNKIPEYTKKGTWQAFAKGGLVNYTGPAWVDGSPARPEAFLNAEDTKNIATFTNVLSNLLSLTPFRQNQSVDNSTTTTINVTVNVDSISDDYDVHNAVQKVKDEIVAAAQRIGSTVILHQ